MLRFPASLALLVASITGVLCLQAPSIGRD